MTKQELINLDYQISIACEVLFGFGMFDEIQGACIAEQLIAEDMGLA